MIAVIAGTGTLPLVACQNLIQQKQPFFVVSLFAEDNGIELQEVLHGQTDCINQSCYRPAGIIELLKARGTTHVVMLGKVDKKCLLQKIKLDWLAIKLLASIAYKNDTEIMERIVAEFAHHNIKVLRQDDVLPGLLIKPGVLCGTVNDDLMNNITLGMKTVNALSQNDIGQTVVVKNNMILAVEAIEGTDECIKRGVQLGGSSVIVCKGARLDQNRSFDLPTLGPRSLHFLNQGDVAAFAWISSMTLITQQHEFKQRALDLGITLISI